MSPTEPQEHLSVSNQTLEAENERLRARVKELEAELSGGSRGEHASSREQSRRRRPRHIDQETEERLREIPDRAAEELDRLARGVSYAIAEGLRSASDVIHSFTDEILDRRVERSEHRSEGRFASGHSGRSHRKEEKDSDRECRTSFSTADDALAGAVSIIDETLEGPQRVVRRFFDGYEGEGGSRSSERRTHTRTEATPDGGHRAEVREESKGVSGSQQS